MIESFEDELRRGGAKALRAAGAFFMGDDAVHRSLRKITSKLDELSIPFAVAGRMAVVAHGYVRTALGIEVLLPAEALARVHAELEGRGHLAPFEGSRDLRDTETGVRIEFLLAGQFPGDGKPKPVAFPEPSQASVVIDGIRFLSLEKLVELKLASGMTNPGRIKDLADVQELIRALRLDERFAERLDGYVRAKFVELWRAVRAGGAGPS